MQWIESEEIWNPNSVLKWSRTILTIVVAGIASLISGPGRADDDPFEDLRQRIEKLERENQRLQSQETFRVASNVPSAPGDAVSEGSDQTPTPAGAGSPGGQDLIQQRLSNLESMFGTMQHSLEMGVLSPTGSRSTDISPILKTGTPTYPSAKLTGFFQMDNLNFNQSGGNQHQFGTMDNNTGFRRARLAAVGDVSQNVSYMLEMDFAFPGRPTFMDVWLDVHNIMLLGNVRAGQWRQPFGMDNLTSIRELTFLERPLSFGLAPFRQTGLGFHDTNEDITLTWASSVYGSETDAWGNTFGNKGYGSSTRITGIPVFEDDGKRVMHFGFDYCLTVPGPNGVIYRNTPEMGGLFGSSSSQVVPGGNTGGGISGDTPFVYNTGALFFNQSNMFNVEYAGVLNHLHWQSELTYNVMNFGGTTACIPAAYAQAAYLLTGEVRPYNKVAGVLGRIKPLCPFGECGGMGAWEVAARYSYIDTNPVGKFGTVNAFSPAQTGPGGVIPFGGAVNDVTMGVNWYLNTYTKVQFNYIIANVNRGGVSSVVDVLAVRAQLDF